MVNIDKETYDGALKYLNDRQDHLIELLDLCYETTVKEHTQAIVSQELIEVSMVLNGLERAAEE